MIFRFNYDKAIMMVFHMNLKTILIPLLILGGSLVFNSCSIQRESSYVQRTKSRFTLIIMYDTTIGKQPLLKAMKRYKAKLLYDYKNFNGVAISISDTYDETTVIHFFEKVSGVISVQRDRKMQLFDKRE